MVAEILAATLEAAQANRVARIRIVEETTEEETANTKTTRSTVAEATRGTLEEIAVEVAMTIGAEADDKPAPTATPRVAVGALPQHPTAQPRGAKYRRNGRLGQRHPLEPESPLSQF